jgi:hypothetical protein
MKKPIFPLLMLAASVVFVSCKKESPKPSAGTNTLANSSLIGSKWTVVNESQVVGAIFPGGSPGSSNYIGKAGDYFNFNANGHLYFSISDQKDTTGTTYKISGDTVLCRNYFYEGTSAVLDSGFYAAYIIRNLTNNTCTLYSSAEGPDTDIENTINLSK